MAQPPKAAVVLERVVPCCGDFREPHRGSSVWALSIASEALDLSPDNATGGERSLEPDEQPISWLDGVCTKSDTLQSSLSAQQNYRN